MIDLMIKKTSQNYTLSGQDLKEDLCVRGLATDHFFFHACIPSKEVKIAVFAPYHYDPKVSFAWYASTAIRFSVYEYFR